MSHLDTWKARLSRTTTSTLLILMGCQVHTKNMLDNLDLDVSYEDALGAIWADVDARIPSRSL